MAEAARITCQLCGAQVHAIKLHLKDAHPEISIAQYCKEYPEAPLLSAHAEDKLRQAQAASKGVAAATPITSSGSGGMVRLAMHEVFGLGDARAARAKNGQPILIQVMDGCPGFEDLVPDVDPAYVFNIDLVKTCLMGLELGIPTYNWGHAGTGKTTNFEQICARTKRPFLRIQHTVNTEESHIVGQTLVRAGETYFEPGPLTVAMKYGLVYCADEYDFALPGVSSVYQPVLEGKPLVIKEAPPEWRVVRPHPNFRFIATGNTNGCGDETGLYQGTNIQNAANYERFGIVEEVKYMPPSQESLIIQQQGGVSKEVADRMVEFANSVRDAYSSGKIGHPVSPRALINAANVGRRRGEIKDGLMLAFANRLSRVDRETVSGFAQRIFG